MVLSVAVLEVYRYHGEDAPSGLAMLELVGLVMVLWTLAALASCEAPITYHNRSVKENLVQEIQPAVATVDLWRPSWQCLPCEIPQCDPSCPSGFCFAPVCNLNNWHFVTTALFVQP